MATAKNKQTDKPDGEALPVSDATDGGDSRLTAGYPENPDKPDATSIAQVEELHEEERA